MSNVDTFIERADRIYKKFRKAPALALKAKREGLVLLRQFEKYLETRGLEAPAKVRRAHKATI